MGWEFVASGLFAAIIRFLLLIFVACLLISFTIIFFLTRKIEGKKKWILRLVFCFALPVSLSVTFADRFCRKSDKWLVELKAIHKPFTLKSKMFL